MRVGPVWIAILFLVSLIACNTNTPPPTSVPVVPQPSSTVPPTAAAMATPLLSINLITPTPAPTDLPAQPTEIVTATIPAVSGATPGSLARPIEIGNTAADAALVAVLQNCWHVSDPRLLNGNLAAHRDAFNCARAPLANVAQTYPTFALVHRVIAWGYYYKDNDIPNAVQEYTKAATLYHQDGDRVGESEARMRLGLLLVSNNRSQACGEFAQAGNLDPTNDRAITYYNSYACSTAGNLTSGGTPVAAPVLQANLDQVRGKILFKSDRDGGESTYVMDPDGRNPKRVASTLYAAAMQWESWSPDHTQVAVVRNEGATRKFGYNNDIWITDPTGAIGRPLANPANDYDAAWSPGGLFDGKLYIAFVSNRGDSRHGLVQGEEIWIMTSDSATTMRLTCFGVASKHPSWSPDSSSIIFHSNFQTGSNRNQIYIMNLGGLPTVSDTCQVGGTYKNLSNNNFSDYEPVWVK
jgi:hypothetical protein